MKCFLVQAFHSAQTASRFWALCKGNWTSLTNDTGRVTCRDCKRLLKNGVR